MSNTCDPMIGFPWRPSTGGLSPRYPGRFVTAVPTGFAREQVQMRLADLHPVLLVSGGEAFSENPDAQKISP